ncbi:MAG: adenosylcobinamide-GDP ribazoletransferase [Clostridioides sp.]|nr:adenosylcobinamide-GDP ribazoletransferase [Clostridioides sp.]
MKRFLLTLQLLTKIPVKYNAGFDEDFHKGIIYFPLVGFIIGLIMYVVAIFMGRLFGFFLASIFTVLVEVLLTGGLHLDGLGDTFDSIYSYRDRDKMLEIMKDSRLGTNALLAVVFTVLIKIAFIFNIMNSDMMWIVMFMPIFSRLIVIWMTYKTESPRKEGMGNVFIGKTSTESLLIAVLYTIPSTILIGMEFFVFEGSEIINLLFTTAVLFIFVDVFKHHIYSKIGGITGDVLGCTIELSELVYLFFITAFGYIF